MRLVECVPNFSEGRNKKTLDAIADAIKSVAGVSLLDVDPGVSTNRTVFTFVGEPEAAKDAAFQAIATASKLIDMRHHKGEHPRMGATDVCPFIPVSEISMQECAELAESLGKRVGEELGIPIYLYAEAARSDERKSLADIRKGEYEALPVKMEDPSFRPDFGPAKFNAASGATVIGARPFLIAYNINLNTKSKKLANEIAFNIREAGRNKKDAQGKVVKDNEGNPVKVPGTLKACRAVGWYVDEYERAQVSINLIDYNQTSLHHAFDECCRQAEQLGVRVTGSEIVGLVPLEPMLDAGRHYLEKQGRCIAVSNSELITCAVQSLGLAELAPFKAAEKIVEYCVESNDKLLTERTVSSFLDELASESAAPGGGSVAALFGSLSASLTSMVANLTFEKKGLEEHRSEMNRVGSDAQKLKKLLCRAVDEDMQAFNKIIDARRLPKGSAEEIANRDAAILDANKCAIEVPMRVLRLAAEALGLAEVVVEKGNPNSLSDAGVAGLAALAAAEGAFYNVLINISGLADDAAAAEYCKAAKSEAERHVSVVRDRAEKLRTTVLSRL